MLIMLWRGRIPTTTCKSYYIRINAHIFTHKSIRLENCQTATLAAAACWPARSRCCCCPCWWWSRGRRPLCRVFWSWGCWAEIGTSWHKLVGHKGSTKEKRGRKGGGSEEPRLLKFDAISQPSWLSFVSVKSILENPESGFSSLARKDSFSCT